MRRRNSSILRASDGKTSAIFSGRSQFGIKQINQKVWLMHSRFTRGKAHTSKDMHALGKTHQPVKKLQKREYPEKKKISPQQAATSPQQLFSCLRVYFFLVPNPPPPW